MGTTNQTPTARPYQQEARYQMNTLINGGRHPVFVSPTGTGKTFTSALFIEDQIGMGRNGWILTPQDEIHGQWMKALHHLNPGYINHEGVRGRNRNLYVCMPQTLINLLPHLPESMKPDWIVTDEAHHSAAATWEAIYDAYPDATRIGLTATPRRTDRLPLDRWYTDIVSTITMREAIDAGFLAEPQLIVPEEYYHGHDVPIVGGDYDAGAQAELLGDSRIIGDVIQTYGEVFAGLPILVACSTFEHASMMTEQFKSAGWNWAHIHSGLSKQERRGMLRRIRSGELNGLCTVGIGIEGMDIPGLYGLIWLRRTLSLTIYLQFIGRVLRTMPGKTHGTIIDPVGNLFIHGWPDATREWSLDGVDPEAPPDDTEIHLKHCPVCGTANASINTTCHMCGVVFDSPEALEARSRRLPTMVDGRLVPVANEAQEQARQDRIATELRESKARSEQKATAPREATVREKGDLIRRNLFKDTSRRKLFQEAVRDWMGE